MGSSLPAFAGVAVALSATPGTAMALVVAARAPRAGGPTRGGVLIALGARLAIAAR